eukprot:CAMPEP_0170466896 /NCGR_PEP_ID=MMETSP0123-20130129/10680_1 /TAXON_ID=182087 /ORGANISM="Favella ehrenbergii, Strain Fehren 1" /LENGTH=174 /DNA_ID=CAMNT_0010733131 /DNA_START=19 /DNA_END=543 /DNA_ORIENTATION=+
MASLLKLMGSAAVLGSTCWAKDFPNPDDINELNNGQTPKNTVRVITSDQPYNADQNTMDFTYQVTQDEFGVSTLFVTLKSRIEIGTSGTQVYNMLGFWDDEQEHWDYLRCAINFDGAVNANANSRYWVISDHYSEERAYSTGVLNISLDKGQDWRSTGAGQNFTECPLLQKCIF